MNAQHDELEMENLRSHIPMLIDAFSGMADALTEAWARNVTPREFRGDPACRKYIESLRAALMGVDKALTFGVAVKYHVELTTLRNRITDALALYHEATGPLPLYVPADDDRGTS